MRKLKLRKLVTVPRPYNYIVAEMKPDAIS